MRSFASLIQEAPLWLKGQASTPAAPDPGYVKLYVKSDGRLYARTGGGEVLIPYGSLATALHSNPEFEIGSVGSSPTSWQVYWGTGAGKSAAIDNTVFMTGTQSCKWTLVSGGTPILQSDVINVVGGQILTVGYNLVGSNSTVRAQLEVMWTSDGSNPDYFGATITSLFGGYKTPGASGFKSYTNTFFIPAEATKIRLNWRCDDPASPANSYMWIDDTSSALAAAPAEGMTPGTIIEWPASSLPSGYLELNAATPLIATYPALAQVLGTTYGGNGTTTFGLPLDLPRVADRASVTSATGIFTIASGWTLTSWQSQVVDGVCYFNLTATKTSPAITAAGTTGDLTNTDVGTFAAAYAPVISSAYQAVIQSGNSGPIYNFTLSSAGLIQLTAGPPSAGVAIGAVMPIVGSFRINPTSTLPKIKHIIKI